MSRRWLTMQLCTGLFIGLAGACGLDEAGRVVVQSTRVQVELDPGIDVCGGQLAMYENFMDQAVAIVGLTLPADFRVSIHAWNEDSRDDVPDRGAPVKFEGVVQDGEAYLFRQRVDLHEVGHVVFSEVVGRSRVSLQEGLADAVSAGGAPFLYAGTPSSPLAKVLFKGSADFDSLDYFVAGMFVRYVIDTYGPATYRALHRSFAEMVDELDGRARFEAVLGASVEEVDADFASQWRCGYQVPWCADDIVPQSLPVVVSEVLDCGAADTLGYTGPDSDLYTPYRVIPFEIEEGQRLSFVGSAARWSVRRCGECSEQTSGGVAIAEVGETVDQTAPFWSWPGGRYYVVVEAVDPDVAVALRIEALP